MLDSIGTLDSDNYGKSSVYTYRSQVQKEEVLSIAKQALRSRPNDISLFLRSANALLSLERFEEALRGYERIIGLDTNYTFAYIGKGITLNGLHQYANARTALEHAIKLDSKFVPTYLELGYNFLMVEKNQEAHNVVDQAIRLESSNAESYYAKSLIYCFIGIRSLFQSKRNYLESVAAIDQAIEIGPNILYFYYWKALPLLKLKRYDDAVKMLECYIQLIPDKTEGYNSAYIMLKHLGRRSDAEKWCRNAFKAGISVSSEWETGLWLPRTP